MQGEAPKEKTVQIHLMGRPIVLNDRWIGNVGFAVWRIVYHAPYRTEASPVVLIRSQLLNRIPTRTHRLDSTYVTIYRAE